MLECAERAGGCAHIPRIKPITPHAVAIRSHLRKIISFSYELDEDKFYMKILALYEICNFVVWSFLFKVQ
jgi:hypothetical protein